MTNGWTPRKQNKRYCKKLAAQGEIHSPKSLEGKKKSALKGLKGRKGQLLMRLN